MKKYFLLFFVAIFTLVGCGDSGKTLKIGDNVFTKQSCLSAISDQAYDDMTQASVRRDESVIAKMVGSGEVYVIPDKIKGVIREVGFRKYLIEFDLLPNTQRLWVSSDFVE